MKVSISFSDASHARTALDAIRKVIPNYADNLACGGDTIGFPLEVEREQLDALSSMFDMINAQVDEHSPTFIVSVKEPALQ